MSKNGQMLSLIPVVIGPSRATAGAARAVQGVYGARGNLELVACDAADGLWVFWFNSDLASDPLETPDVPPGTWSEGLHFAEGTRYIEAQILQSDLGPSHLELLALTADGVLQSWYWSPRPGFQRRAADAAIAVERFAASHDEGTLRVTIAAVDGSVRGVVSTPDGYPERRWAAASDGPELDVDATGALAAAGVDPLGILAGTPRATESRRSGGAIELTWRDARGALCHLAVPRRDR